MKIFRAILLSFAFILVDFHAFSQPWEENSMMVKATLAYTQNVDGVLTLIDEYGTKIIFNGADVSQSGSKINNVKGITIESENPCIVGAQIYSPNQVKFTSDASGYSFSNASKYDSNYLNKGTWDATTYASMSAASPLTVTGIAIYYDLWPRLFINGKLVQYNDDVMRNDRIILHTYIEPTGPLVYQYKVYGNDTPLTDDWSDVDKDNGFSLSEFIAQNEVDLDYYSEFKIYTKLLYVVGDYDYYCDNGLFVLVFYKDEDRVSTIPPAIPILDERLVPDENNIVIITGDDITFNLSSEEGTTIWYKLSDPTALKIKSRSGEIIESEYEDSGTHNKEMTITSNCDLSYFSKNIASGLNSELTTIRFVKNDNGNSTAIATITEQTPMRYYDLSGRRLTTPPSQGFYIKVPIK